MTVLEIVLATACVATVIAAGYLLLERTRLLLRAAGMESERDVSRREALAAAESLRIERTERAALDERAAALSIEAAQLRERLDALTASRLEYERQLEQRLHELREQFKHSMDSSAAAALKQTSEQFLKLAGEHFDNKTKQVDELVKPISETLKATREKLELIEKDRTSTYAKLHENIRAIAESSDHLRKETGKLTQALRKPQVRGRYGEIQLERVVELAGMRAYCDFESQSSVRDDEGRLLRPDLVVRLPNDRIIAVDAKTNIEAYLDGIEAETPELQAQHIDRFARHVAEQAEKLASKSYWSQFDGSPEFVVMFIPGDQFIDAALQRRPDLLDLAAQKRVIIASPSTLIGLFSAVNLGWREQRLAESASDLFELGRELHERAATAFVAAADIGKNIDRAQKAYNAFVGSVESRLMPTLRKFEEQGAKSQKKLDALEPLDGATREFQSIPVKANRDDAPLLIEPRPLDQTRATTS